MMSDIPYKITGFAENTAQLGVWFDGAPHPEWLWLPISENGEVPIGDELHNWIMLHFPTAMASRSKLLKNGITNLNDLAPVLPPVPEPRIPTDAEIQAMHEADAVQIKPVIDIILRGHGLIV
jgi:hypothetical protein